MVISNRGKPPWLTIRPPENIQNFQKIKEVLSSHGLVTVCEEAHCPNIPECWSKGTVTFMILGKYCTRGCKFCNVESKWTKLPPDPLEPENLARAIAQLGLDYVVITSVNRDDLPDQGSNHFAECIKAVKKYNPKIIVEVLIPDFCGDMECIKRVVKAKPEVIAHNIETVRRLQKYVRDRRAGYEQSLSVLENVKKLEPKIFTKSSIIVGFGETVEEVLQTMKDLRAVNVDFLTVGQYLRPSDWHLPVTEYVTKEKFEYYKKMGESMGFLYVAAGPFVRSSYRAGELFVKSLISKGYSF
jgi:lipoic acid synthetase